MNHLSKEIPNSRDEPVLYLCITDNLTGTSFKLCYQSQRIREKRMSYANLQKNWSKNQCQQVLWNDKSNIFMGAF